MTKLLNLTIKIDNKTKYKKGSSLVAAGTPPRTIELTGGSLEIKDQNGVIVSELKSSNFGGGNFSVNDIKNIEVFFSVLDIPISWAWENRGVDNEIEFTLKNLKYDEGFRFGTLGLAVAGTAADTLFLSQGNFDGFEVFKCKTGNKYRLSQIIELSSKFSTDIKKTLCDFLDLRWKITKAEDDEQIARFVPKIKSWQNAPSSLKQKFYQLKNINDDSEEVKKICSDFLRQIQDLDEWKKVGIKTLTEAWTAQQNGFDIIDVPSLRSQITPQGKYRGFPIASEEKRPTVIIGSQVNSIGSENRYTKDNIDFFRDFFTNDKDQTEPKYFRGFRPGDIKRASSGKFMSVNHKADIRDKKKYEWEIKNNEDFTRTYYEFKSYSESNNRVYSNELLEIILGDESFDEIQTKQSKTKKECLDIYWEWKKEFWSSDSKSFKETYQKLTDLFSVLDNSYVNQSKNHCEAGLNILQNYESPDDNSDEKSIKDKFASEIDAKKTEITNRMKEIHSEAINAAANEDYGSGSLNPERKKIFTTYRNQIETDTILTEIKELIKLLVKGEKIIPEVNRLTKMILANKLKEEYQNGKEDKKTAYTIVNQVDNQWVDQVIADLGKFTKKDPTTLLAERRTRLQSKYNNSAVAQAVFGNDILDSVAALEEAEKLLIKVEEAGSQNDTNASLLTFLVNYQKAQEGTIKNKAWQAVNSFNQQAEVAIKHLQKNDQSREEIIRTIQEAKNESELEAAYSQVQNSQLYQQGGKSKTVIDNLKQRKKVLFEIKKDSSISAENKTFLQTVLIKLIPETIQNDQDEQKLTELENELKNFLNASEGEGEKEKIYKKYKKIIDQILAEISQEKQRYQQTKQKDISGENGDGTSQKPKGIPNWVWGFIIIGVIAAGGIIAYIIRRNSRKISKRV